MKKKSASLGSQRILRVFLCHASEDKAKVAEIRDRLREEGDDPWLDEEQLKGGEDWEQEIKSAIRASDCVVIFLTQNSIEKKGFYQKEIRWALEIALEQPDGHHFIIPAMLEKCSIPNNLAKSHAVDISGERGYRLVTALNKRRQQLTSRNKTGSPLPPRSPRPTEGTIRLSNHDCDQFAQIIANLGIDLRTIAKETGVNQTWLAQVLKGHRNVAPTKLGGVATVLADHLESHADGTGSSTARVTLKFLMSFIRDAGLAHRKMPQAGRPLDVSSNYYVERAVDTEALQFLRRTPFTMLVQGPVQSGKTSMLLRFREEARRNAIETAYFDPSQGITSNAALKLVDTLQRPWGLPAPEDAPHSLTDVLNWLIEVLAPTKTKPRLLIIDDLASLGEASGEWLTGFIRGLQFQHSAGLDVSIAVGRTYYFGNDFRTLSHIVTSKVNWDVIEVGWFEQDECEDLETTVSANQTKDGKLFTLFRGQPYLTHVAAGNRKFRELAESWTERLEPEVGRALRATEPYRRHLEILRSTILGPSLEVGPPERKLLEALLETCGDIESPGPVMERNHEKFLRSAKLLDNDNKPLLPLYRLIAQDLMEE